MMDYTAMLQGRPFAERQWNPYLDMFRNFVEKAEAFKRQAPQIAQSGTLARASDRTQPGAALGGDEYRRPAAPQGEMFGGQ